MTTMQMYEAMQPGDQVLLIAPEKMAEYGMKPVYRDLFGTIVTVREKYHGNRFKIEEASIDGDGDPLYFYDTEIVELLGPPQSFTPNECIDVLFG